MESFEDLGVSPSLVEALAAEGIEVPTALQAAALPVLRRGHSAVLRGGPGAGVLLAFGIPLLERLEAGGNHPRALVLTPTRERAGSLALALARVALGTEHRVAALGGAWALPERASLLFGTPVDVATAVAASHLKLDEVEAFVLEGASQLLEGSAAEAIEPLLSGIGTEAPQIILAGDPVTPAVRAFADRHLRRGVFLPSDSASESSEAGAEAALERGRLEVRVVEKDRDAAVAAVVAERLGEGDAAHVLLFVRSPDRAADLGDLLALQGYASGAPGDPEAPVWLGLEPLEAREALKEAAGPVAVLSVDVPSDADDLDRRHGGPARGGVVLARSRELPHLRRTAREAGYAVTAAPMAFPDRDREAEAFRREVARCIEEEDLLPGHLLLEPLLRTHGAADVAAALAGLLRRRTPAVERTSAPQASTVERTPGRPPAWVRLFLSIGQRDGIGAGDLLGAILGESGIAGDQVGRIEVRDTFSRVEVQEGSADRVIQALNGTSIRGRSIRADFDRGADRRPEGGARGGSTPRGSGGPRGPGRGGEGRKGGPSRPGRPPRGP